MWQFMHDLFMAIYDIMFYGRRIFPKYAFSPSYFFSTGILAHGKTERQWEYC